MNFDDIDRILKEKPLPLCFMDRKMLILYLTREYHCCESTAKKYYESLLCYDYDDNRSLNSILYHDELFEKNCDTNNIVYIDAANITRNGVSMLEFVSLTFVSEAAVKLMENNNHILYVDASFSSDHGAILLAVFMDSNHMIQPVGFQIAPGETKSSWFLFMEALKSAGINYDDLVINSDRFDGIVSAVKEFFPQAEHVYCSVHLERNIQDLWCKTYDQLTYDNGNEVRCFNKFMAILNLARISSEEEECNEYLKQMQKLEMEHNRSKEAPVYDYIIEEGNHLFMHRWKYQHYMLTTNNPAEVCMKELDEPRYGLKSCRETTLFNKYRYLVRWIYERIETRYYENNHPSLVPIIPDFPIPNQYMEKEILRMAHEYTVNKSSYSVIGTGNRNINLEKLSTFLVTHKPTKTTYNVDIRNHCCSCHEMHWKKYPCIHYIAVLHGRQNYSSVWSTMDKVYTRKETLKTCRPLTTNEKTLLDEIFKRIEAPVVIHEQFRKVRGAIVKRNLRLYSRGEIC